MNINLNSHKYIEKKETFPPTLNTDASSDQHKIDVGVGADSMEHHQSWKTILQVEEEEHTIKFWNPLIRQQKYLSFINTRNI